MLAFSQHVVIIFCAEWDEEAQVWVASSTDIDGLATGAATLEELREKIPNPKLR